MTFRHARVVSAAGLAIGLTCVLSMRCSESSPLAAADGGLDVVRDRRGPYDVSQDDAADELDLADADDADAGPVCSPPAGLDGLVHDWPGWTRTTAGLDKCCPMDSLDDLSKAVAYDWVSCGSGCLRFNAPTSDISTVAPEVAAEVVRGSSGAASQVFITRNGLKGGVSEKSIYDFATGTPKAAWRIALGPHCIGDIEGATDDSAMLSLALYPTPFAPTTGVVVANAKVETLSQSPMGAQSGLPWNFLSPLYANGRGAFSSFSGQVATCDMHTPGAPTCIKANVASIAPAILNGVSEFFIEGEYVYALSTLGNAGWSQEYVIGPKGDVKLLRGLANTHVGGLASDGKSLTWVEVQGDMSLSNPQKIEEVWNAPLTGDPTQLAGTAKKLATLPSATAPNIGVSFNGYYSMWVSGDIYVVRISDGAFIKSPPMPVPYSLFRVFYITATEIWVMAEHNSSIQLFRLTLPAWQ